MKSLANQRAKAAEDIASQIASIQSVTGQAVTAIQGIGGIIEQINEISATIASAVEEQGTATQEITRKTQEAARGTEQSLRHHRQRQSRCRPDADRGHSGVVFGRRAGSPVG